MKNLSRLLPSSVDPLKLAVLGIAAWSALLGSCSQTPVTVNLHALQASGNVSFVCRGDDGAPSGHKLDECPEVEHSTRQLIALVTQTATNEVALVDLVAQSIVDVDQTTPGYSFLRVGARPGAIVSTPGGAATFVGVSGLNKNGIFALPTTCLSAPKRKGESARDLTTWSACSLTSAPGEMTVIVDPAGASRDQCPGSPAATPLEPIAQLDRECPAVLSGEAGPAGRRKLLVSLPEEHKLVLLDAQNVLDQNPGEFTACTVEREYALKADVPATVSPVLPPDLVTSDLSCPTTSYPKAESGDSTPAGFALADTLLYVADRTQPVVHRLDLSDPCAAKELPPLLPHSYLAPERVVTTSRVAVSPLTPSGKQFVYAVDDTDQPSASVMAFDVSPGPPEKLQRTPLVFRGAPRQPYLPPDRLRFSAPVRDVSFVLRDFPKANVSTGAGQFGLTCDPAPGDEALPGAAYRSNADFTDGARPNNLRGVFGFVMLINGQIAIIDVEDFDAACRRPLSTNPLPYPLEDFRGCSADPGTEPNQSYFTNPDTHLPTVTNESSCHVVEAHRPRAASLSISSATVGLRAPTLRSFPQFSNPDPSALVSVTEQPHLLAVDFPNPDPKATKPIPAQVSVSTQVYAHCVDRVPGATPLPPPCDSSTQELSLDPYAMVVQNSLTLPLAEPRSYAENESPALTFEGRVFADRTSAYLQIDPSDASTGAVNDPDANFCAAGVEDSETILPAAESLGIPATRRAAWAAAHADYVQITGDFPPSDNSYWRVGEGRNCAAYLNSDGGDRDACAAEFGNIDTPAVLKATRDLAITSAFYDHLNVKPRGCTSPADCAAKMQQLSCCFPSGTAYTVRASQQWLLSGTAGLHDLAAGAGGRCVHTASCDPRKRYFGSRAFEVCDPTNDPDKLCSVTKDSVGCVAGTVKNDAGASVANYPVTPGGPASACIFENLTARFVVYRGSKASTRGMTFSWQTTGGFVPLSMSLATQSSAVNPQSMAYLPEFGYLAVIDGSTLGLSLFNLDSLGVVPPSPYF